MLDENSKGLHGIEGNRLSYINVPRPKISSPPSNVEKIVIMGDKCLRARFNEILEKYLCPLPIFIIILIFY